MQEEGEEPRRRRLGVVPEFVRVGGEVAGAVPGGPPGCRPFGGADACHSISLLPPSERRRSDDESERCCRFGSAKREYRFLELE